jgi:hypothetical protein
VRPISLIAIGVGVFVIVNELRWIGYSSLWVPIISLAVAVILLGYAQVRHG